MPILTYFNNMWYGSASGAMITGSIAETNMNIKGSVRLNLTDTIELPAAYLKPTLLINSPLIVEGVGAMEKALPKGDIRMALDVRVNQLTQDDVTGAVLEAQVENGLTLKQAIRVLLSVMSGKTIIEGGEGGTATVKFRDVNDTKDRVTAIMAGSQRSEIIINAI